MVVHKDLKPENLPLDLHHNVCENSGFWFDQHYEKWSFSEDWLWMPILCGNARLNIKASSLAFSFLLSKQRGVKLFLQWAMMQRVAMLLQNRYQWQRLYACSFVLHLESLRCQN